METSAAAPSLLTCKSPAGLRGLFKTGTQTHPKETCTNTDTQRQTGGFAVVIQKSHRAPQRLGSLEKDEWMADGWMVGAKTGWQDDKTQLRTRSSTVWQLGGPTRDLEGREKCSEKKREESRRKNWRSNICDPFFMESITLTEMGEETENQGCRKEPTRQNWHYTSFSLQHKLTFDGLIET